jgi:hypothetical protein
VKVPTGITTISGHSGQSLKVSFGVRQRFSLPISASTPSHRVCGCAIAGIGWVKDRGAGPLGGATTATCCLFNSSIRKRARPA